MDRPVCVMSSESRRPIDRGWTPVVGGEGTGRRVALLLLLSMATAACGTRLDEAAVYDAQGTASIEEIGGGRSADGEGLGTSVGGSDGTDGVVGGTGTGGGDSGSTGGKGAGPAARVTVPPAVQGTTGVSNEVIKIGGIFPLSGGLSALGRPVEQAARAYFRHVNDAGGINGRKIQFIAEDDAADPNRTRSAAEKLVSQDGIFAMGPSFTPFSPDLVAFLEGKGVPFIGFDGVNEEGFHSASTLSAGASITPHADILIPYWRETTGLTNIGVVYLDVPPAVSYLNHTRDVICPQIGCRVVRAQPVQFTTTDFVSILVAMQQANAQGIFIVTDPASAVKMLLQARQIDYTPQPGGYMGQHGIYLDIVPESCGSFCDGIMAPSSLFPPQEVNAATEEMKAVVSKYYSDVDYGYFTELGYLSAKILVDILSRAGEPERGKVVQIAHTLSAYDTGGFTNPANPVNLTPGREHPREMVLVEMRGGTWRQATEWLTPRRFK